MAIRIFLMGKRNPTFGAGLGARYKVAGLKALRLRQSFRGRVSPVEKPSHDLSVESDVIRATMQAFSRMPKRRPASRISILLFALAMGPCPAARPEPPTYDIDQGVALADTQNPDV